MIYITEDESKNNEFVKEYKNILYKFVLFLMGYNVDEFNEMEDLIKNDLKGKNEKKFYYELYLKLKDKFDKNKNEDNLFEK